MRVCPHYYCHLSDDHTQDWTSGPDRYQVTREGEPEWGWMRIFTFYAYAASKYHVLETTESPMAQKAREISYPVLHLFQEGTRMR